MADRSAPPAGVVEGFYGRPWTWAARRRLVERLGSWGLNRYIHAPKDDLPHRRRWREPYGEATLRQFRDLVRLGERAGVVVGAGVSPLRMRFADPAELEILLSKLAALHRTGVRSFALLLDDMDPDFVDGDSASRFRTLASAHAWLANETWSQVSRWGALELSFTPTDYCGDGRSPYLRELGRRLDPAIDVHWTGTAVCSPTISATHLAAIGRVLRRPPLVWDNYPVDDGDMEGELHLLPFRGRGADAPSVARGWVVNGALEPGITGVVVRTFADWWRDPAGYEPSGSWSRAICAVAPRGDEATAIHLLGDVARSSALDPAGGDTLSARIAAFWTTWTAHPTRARRRLALGRLEVLVAELTAAGRRLDALTNAELRGELAPWVRQLGRTTAVVDAGRALLEATSESRPDSAIEAGRRRLTTALRMASAGRAYVANAAVEAFGRRCLAIALTPVPPSRIEDSELTA